MTIKTRTLIDVRNDMLKVWDDVNSKKPDLDKIAQQNNTAGKILAFAAIDLKASIYMKLKPDMEFLGISEGGRERPTKRAPESLPESPAANAATIKKVAGKAA